MKKGAFHIECAASEGYEHYIVHTSYTLATVCKMRVTGMSSHLSATKLYETGSQNKPCALSFCPGEWLPSLPVCILPLLPPPLFLQPNSNRMCPLSLLSRRRGLIFSATNGRRGRPPLPSLRSLASFLWPHSRTQAVWGVGGARGPHPGRSKEPTHLPPPPLSLHSCRERVDAIGQVISKSWWQHTF